MTPERPDRVGVRELRQNLSVHLRRVKEGATLEVTEHGHAVARLTPLPQGDGLLDRMIADGRAIPAEGSIEEFLTVRPAVSPDIARRLQRELRRQRRDKV